jgi:hypothetical protein
MALNKTEQKNPMIVEFTYPIEMRCIPVVKGANYSFEDESGNHMIGKLIDFNPTKEILKFQLQN